MGLVISLSGVGNTCKSSLINGHPEAPGLVELFEKQRKTVLVLGEVAREVAEAIGTDDMSRFQEEISQREYVRAYHLLKDKELYDVILVDRTYIDNLAYYMFNVLQGNIEGSTNIATPPIDPYDAVIYFDTPVKETTTEAFQHYNETLLNDMMGTYVKNRFGEKVKLFQNGVVDREKILSYISKLTGVTLE